MSISTVSDIVNNVARIGEFRDLINLAEEYAKAEDDFIGKDYDIGGGWTIVKYQANRKEMGTKGRLFGELAVKGDLEVCLVNTSPYAGECEYDYAVFSDDRKSVEAFPKRPWVCGIRNHRYR